MAELVRVTIRAHPLGDAATIIPAEIERAFLEALSYLEREVKQRTPRGVTQTARGSIVHQVERDGAKVLGRLGSPVRHVQVLNDGRMPGSKMPADPDGTIPPEGLVLWVRRNIPITFEGKRGKTRRRAATVDEAKEIAMSIARAIKYRGTKPVRMFEGAVEAGRGELDKIFAASGMRIAVELTKPSSN